MRSLLDVLRPQTPPEPKGARVVCGKFGRAAIEADAADRSRKDEADLSPHTTKIGGEFLRAYRRQKTREYRERQRKGISLRPRKEKAEATLAEKYDPPSFIKPLARTRGVYGRR